MTKPANQPGAPANINASRVTPPVQPVPVPVPPPVKPSGPLTYTVQKGANTLPDFSNLKK
jgi:hypothetical protein